MACRGVVRFSRRKRFTYPRDGAPLWLFIRPLVNVIDDPWHVADGIRMVLYTLRVHYFVIELLERIGIGFAGARLVAIFGGFRSRDPLFKGRLVPGRRGIWVRHVAVMLALYVKEPAKECSKCFIALRSFTTGAIHYSFSVSITVLWQGFINRDGFKSNKRNPVRWWKLHACQIKC